MDGSPDLRRW